MFEINEKVVYANTDVCVIEDITNKKIGFETKKYFVLKPTDDEKSTIFCPVNMAEEKMRYLITVEEAESFIKQIPSLPDSFDEMNEREKRDKINGIVKSGSFPERLTVIKVLTAENIGRKEIGKKQLITEERLLRETKRIVYSEFAAVLGIEFEKVPEYIDNLLEQ